MKRITVSLHRCGMLSGLYSEEIMIYKPIESFEVKFELDETMCLLRVSQLIERFKKMAQDEAQYSGEWEEENLTYEHIYVRTEKELIGLREDKQIHEIFTYFKTSSLCFEFFVVGGASFYCDGYLFKVKPREQIHRYTPHVHVKRDDEETRYYIETAERMVGDEVSRRFLKDEKKRIKPFIEENKERLMEYWNLYMNGYSSPALSENGKQYYPES